MSNKFLNVKFGADTAGFKKGTNEVRAELTELNSAMRKNKREQKELNDEIKKLEKQQKDLKTVMSQVKTPTKEMTDEANRLQKALDEAALKSAKLKTEEQELKGKISATTKELNEQNTAADKNAISMEKVGNAVKKAAMLTATGMAALFTYSAKMAASADEINTIAKQTGLATDEIQKFMYASELIDVSLETLTGSMSRLIRNMNTAATTGSGTAYDAFVALDVAITDASGTLRNNKDVFYEIIDKLALIGDETQRDAYAMALFGKSAQELNPLILGGTQQLKEFGDELEREGLILDQMQLDKLNEFNDKIDTFKAKFQAKMMSSSVDWVDAFDELLDKSDEIVDLVATLITSFAKVTGFIVDHKEVVLALVIAYGSLKAAMNVKDLISNVVETYKTLTTATTNATTAQLACNAAMQAVPYVALATGLSLVISKILDFTKSTSDAKEETKSCVEEINDFIQSEVNATKSEIDLLKQKADRYEELRNKASLTADEERELYNIATEFEAKYPNQISLIDSKTLAYKNMGNQLDELTQKMLDNARMSAYQSALSQAYTDKYNKENEIESAKGELNNIEATGPQTTFLDAVKDIFFTPGHSARKRYAEEYNAAADELNKLEEEYKGILEVISNLENVIKNGYGIGGEGNEITDFSNELLNLKENYSLLVSTEKELESSHMLSIETLNSLTTKYPELKGVVNDYISGMASGEDVVNRLRFAYENDVKSHEEAVKSKLYEDTNYYNQLQQMNGSCINKLASEYGIDLSNYQNYAEAKLAIEQAFLTTKAKNWADYYDAENKKWVGSVKNITTYAKQLKAEGLYTDETINLIVAQKQQEYMDTVNAVNALSHLDFSSDLTDYSKYYYDNYLLGDNVNNGSGTSSSGSTSSKKEISVYEQARASYSKLINDRIEEIKKLTEAETAGADERIAAINAEIEARKKLAETEDLQKRIDFIKGQLKYSLLDEFERDELQKQLAELEGEQADKKWEEEKRAEIAAIEAEKAASEKLSSDTIADLQNRQNYANTLFTDLQNGYQSVTTIANNNSKIENLNIIEKALTEGQITRIVKNALGIGEVF